MTVFAMSQSIQGKAVIGIQVRTATGESTIWATEGHPFWDPSTAAWSLG
jgi:hypothetical protein